MSTNTAQAITVVELREQHDQLLALTEVIERELTVDDGTGDPGRARLLVTIARQMLEDFCDRNRPWPPTGIEEGVR